MADDLDDYRVWLDRQRPALVRRWRRDQLAGSGEDHLIVALRGDG